MLYSGLDFCLFIEKTKTIDPITKETREIDIRTVEFSRWIRDPLSRFGQRQVSNEQKKHRWESPTNETTNETSDNKK